MNSLLKVALATGLSLVALQAAATAGTVRVTVAEYSAKTGPYFEEAEKAFEAANPGIDVQFEVVPWDVLLQKLTTDIASGTTRRGGSSARRYVAIATSTPSTVSER